MKITGQNKLNFRSLLEKDTNYEEHTGKVVEDIYRAKHVDDYDVVVDDLPPFPTEDDYVFFPFRQLTATIVGAGSWKATDFRNEKVLRRGMRLLKNKPAYLNHDLEVGNQVGYVGQPKWTAAYTNKAGEKIPAGIDAPFVIDKVQHPDLVRDMSGTVPVIRASSVTVTFEWEASHEFESEWDFWSHLGEEINGEMVTRVVTKITNFYESSLVWLGADPYAGILDSDGEVQFVDQNGIISASKFDNDPLKNLFDKDKKYYIESCLTGDKKVSLNKVEPEQKGKKGMDLLDFIAKELGLSSKKDLTKEKFQEFKFISNQDFTDGSLRLSNAETSLATANESITSLTSEKESLEQTNTANQTEIASLKTDVNSWKDKATSLESKSKELDTIMSTRIDYAKDMYTKSCNGKTEQVLMEELENETSFQVIETKIELYGGKALNTFGATCTKCNSSESVEFRSSKENRGEQVDGATSEGFIDLMIKEG